MAKKTQLLFTPEVSKEPPLDEPTLRIEEGLPTKPMLLRRETVKKCTACGGTYNSEQQFCPFDGKPLAEEAPYEPTDDDALIGKVLSERYEVVGVIAEGGMGTVYKVRHTKLKSLFAMKVLRRDLAEDTNISDRLIDEARATAAIGHPNIVAAADFGEIDRHILPELGNQKLPYFVMEHLTGYTLAELIKDAGALGPERTANIVSQVASALTAAHAKEIIHRDLKPDNIRLVRDEAGNELAKVVDFGVAKVIGASKKTQKGIVFGTPHYMSPEQGQGDPIDHRTDIYALGVIIYECLTGEVPFVADTFVGIITKHIHTPPPELARSLRKSRLADIMSRCLEKHPDARYESMTEIVNELEAVMPRRRANTHSGSVVRIPGEQDHSPILWAVAALSAIIAIVVAVRYLPDDAPPASNAPEAAAPTTATTDKPAVSAAVASSPTVPSTQPSQTTSAAPSASSAPKPAPAKPPAAPPPPRRRGVPKPSPKPGDVVDPWG